MLVISDTTPLNILVRIGQVEIMPRLFGEVWVPPVVLEEMSHSNTPETIREWVASRPTWLHVKAPAHIDKSIPLDAGELAAICLARELRADLLLLDDQKARQFAQREGIVITGTLGVLELAAAQDMISLPETVQRLRATDFHMADHLFGEALERDALRRQEKQRSMEQEPER